jgi:pimeloyl-ACP methyl ester carboxylesterase
MAGWANDVKQLAEWLLGPSPCFSILGFSAGATYALACGGLPGVQAMSLVSGMGLPHLISGWRRYSEEAFRILLSAKLATFRSAIFLRIEKKQRDMILNQWDKYFGEVKRELPADDRRVLSRPDVEELFRENRREGQAQGAGCLLKDVQALYSDPLIDLRHLAACSVLIVHGTDDKVVPVEVARDLHRRIPSSHLKELPGRGHYFLYDDGQMEGVLNDLLDAHRVCALQSCG